jgi:hypothetical protein
MSRRARRSELTERGRSRRPNTSAPLRRGDQLGIASAALGDASRGRAPSPSGVLALQRLAGNRAAARLLEDQEPRSPVLDVVDRGGKPLPGALRTEMEGRLGHDFSDVRIHTDNAAHVAARSVDAEAFTSGHDIAFAPGRFAPHTTAGKQMLAHELSHVVQQRAGPVSATPVGGGIALSHPGDAHERAAEATAGEAMRHVGAAAVQRRVAFSRSPLAGRRGRVVQRLIDSERLKRLAGQPTGDWSIFGLTLREMSRLYHDVINALDDYHSVIAHRLDQKTADEVRTALGKVQDAVWAYLAKHSTGKTEPRLNAMKYLESDIRAELEAIETVEDEPPAVDTSWAEAIDEALGRWRRASGTWTVEDEEAAPGGPIAFRAAAGDEQVTPEPGEPLAKGGFGAVYKVSGRENRLVKQPLKAHDEFQRELGRQLDIGWHPNVMKVFGRALDEEGESQGALLKFIRGGTLQDALENLRFAYLRNQISAKLYAGAIQRLGADVMAGLAHLHGQGVVHADIHAKNVVLGHKHARAKLIDFTAMPVGAPVRVSHSYGGNSPEAFEAHKQRASDARADWRSGYQKPRPGKLGQLEWRSKGHKAGSAATGVVHRAGGAATLDVNRAGRLAYEALENIRDEDIPGLGQFWNRARAFAAEVTKGPNERAAADALLRHPYLQSENMLITQRQLEETIRYVKMLRSGRAVATNAVGSWAEV